MQSTGIGFTEQFCIEVSPVPSVMVIFGASGDLAQRKLFPALCRLFQRGLFHPKSRIVGFARTASDTAQFQTKVTESLTKFCPDSCTACKEKGTFVERVSYLCGDYGDPAAYTALLQHVTALENKFHIGGNRLLYLSVPSELYGTVTNLAGATGLTAEAEGSAVWRNVIIEKPFGHDATSAARLEHELSQTLQEKQIYRIDHYIGKETVQNIMMLRFANTMFEPLWNRDYIDHVQITAAETLGVGRRAGYYETSGAVRDMFQNHLFQMMATVAMASPVRFDAESLQAERNKLLQSVRPWNNTDLRTHWVRGQYTAGIQDGVLSPGYREENGVAPNSMTETFAAAKVMIDNQRWAGVPFYLRSGKRLAKRTTTISIVFKQIPHSIFFPIRPTDLPGNVLQISVQPEEGISLSFQAKQPGPKMCMGTLSMAYRYGDIFEGPPPEAYERLILDAMLGDQTLFIQSDSIMRSWTLLDPVLKTWENPEHEAMSPLEFYETGTFGPAAADALIRRDHRQWLTP